jgi:competence protein ComEA
MHVNDATDERRLREQRRYFGISSIAPNVPQSISEAKNFGKLAKDFVTTALAKPFTIHTAFSDARGDSKHKRVYAFVVTHEGKDLAEELTAAGLARAFGITRLTFDQRSADEYREHLRDLELRAAIAKTGIWAKTNVNTLSDERLAQRREDEELKIAIGNGKVEEGGAKININQAILDDLLKLPSVGEATAKNIIAARPFQKTSDLSKVKGIGPATLKKLLPLVEVQ